MIVVDVKSFLMIEKSFDKLIGWLYSLKSMQRCCILHARVMCVKALLNHEKGLHIDNDHFMIISPDEGSMNRAIYLANILGVDMGMYYKRLDYSKRINGRHPIAAYEFLGPNLRAKI